MFRLVECASDREYLVFPFDTPVLIVCILQAIYIAFIGFRRIRVWYNGASYTVRVDFYIFPAPNLFLVTFSFIFFIFADLV